MSELETMLHLLPAGSKWSVAMLRSLFTTRSDMRMVAGAHPANRNCPVRGRKAMAFLCGLFDTTELFDDSQLACLYPDNATFAERFGCR